jgi:hypothetical protein
VRKSRTTFDLNDCLIRDADTANWVTQPCKKPPKSLPGKGCSHRFLVGFILCLASNSEISIPVSARSNTTSVEEAGPAFGLQQKQPPNVHFGLSFPSEPPLSLAFLRSPLFLPG